MFTHRTLRAWLRRLWQSPRKSPGKKRLPSFRLGLEQLEYRLAPAVSITTTTLPNWTAGFAGYSQTLNTTGGAGALTFSAAGSLPSGLTLTSGGVLSGTPNLAGSFNFTVTATDMAGASTSQEFSVVINPQVAITTTSLGNWTAGLAGYNQTINVSGGTGSLLVVATNTLPAGLTLGSTGVLSGTPTTAGSYTIAVTAFDSLGAAASRSYTLVINAPASAAGFLITLPTAAAANGFFALTITAVNASGQQATGYTGTVHFMSSDGAAILPANTMLTNGTGTFTATLATLGSQTITITDMSNPNLTVTSPPIQVISPATVVVSPTFLGVPGSMTSDGHTIGFNAFAAIQQAVNVVSAGGTVYVSGGSYHESLTINKSLTLQASGSASAFLVGPGSGTGLTITGTNVNVGGLTMENFGTGLSAASPTISLVLSDLGLENNAAGGSITNVKAVTFIGNGSDETLTASASQFGRAGDNLLTYSGVGYLGLDGNGGTNTLDLSSAIGPVAVALSGPGSLEGFAGTVSIPGLIFTNVSRLVGNGTAGSSLTGLNAPATWTVNGSSMSQYSSSNETLAFANFPVLNGGAGSDTFTVAGSPASGLTINGQGGGDNFQVPLAGLAGPVALSDNGSGANAATLTGASGNSSLTVTSSSVALSGGGTVTYAGLQKLSVNAGAGADAITVRGTAAGTTTTISGGGTDTFVVTSPASLLNTIAGPLTLSGGTGKNYLYLSEANRTTPDTVYVTDSAIISGTGTFAPISYAASGGSFGSGVILIMGNADNTLRVFSTAAGDAYGLYTGNGNSSIVISSPTQTLNTMAGSIAVVAGSGSNLLYVSEAGSSTPDTLSLSATGIQSTAANFAVSYVAPGGTFGRGVYLVTGNGNDSVRIYSTAAGSTNGIDLGKGNNNVVVSSPTQTLNTMAGPIGVQGGTGINQLYISDAGSTVPDSIFVSGVSVQSPTAGYFISYTAAPGGSFGRGVDVVTGSGNNHVYVVGQLAGSPIGVYGGPGNDIIDAFVSALSYYNLWLDGQGGINYLFVHDLTGTATIGGLIGTTSGVVQLTYPGGLPSTIRYSNLFL